MVGGAARDARAQLLPIRLKVGVVNLTDSKAKTLGGTPLFTGEADIVLPGVLTGGQTFLTAGYQERKSNGNDLRVIPLTICRTTSLPNPAAAVTGSVYYGAGFGLYNMRAKQLGVTQTKTSLGGFAVIGYQLPFVGIFAEAKYQTVSGSIAGAHPNGILLLIGKHL